MVYFYILLSIHTKIETSESQCKIYAPTGKKYNPTTHPKNSTTQQVLIFYNGFPTHFCGVN